MSCMLSEVLVSILSVDQLENITVMVYFLTFFVSLNVLIQSLTQIREFRRHL